jgi:chlorite dismutase
MNDWPYHQYWFFDLDRGYYQLSSDQRQEIAQAVKQWAKKLDDVEIVTYATLGFKAGTTFMFWARSHQPEHMQSALRDLLHTPLGEWLTLSHSLFGLIRQSTYSNRPPETRPGYPGQ